jgi:hypothetical protein
MRTAVVLRRNCNCSCNPVRREMPWACRTSNRDSLAWKAGARPGNLLTHVNGQRVTTPSQFHEAVETLDGDVKIRLVSGEITVPAP